MKNSIVKLQSYLKTLVTILLLTMGVSSMWADDCGFWSDGAASITFSLNGASDKTPSDLNGSGVSDYSIGTVTTSLTIKSAWAKVWGRDKFDGITLYYRVKVADATSSAAYSSASLGWDNNFGTNDQFWQNTSINASININLAPGNYEIEYYFFADAKYESDKYLSNGGGNYHANFTIPSKNLTVAGAANGNTVSGSVTGITKGTAYTITATPTTGYTFSGWTATSGSSSITIANTSAATTTVTFNNYSNNATVTASFAAETTHTVTHTEYCTSTSTQLSTESVAVGEVTYSEFSAPVKTGYTFVNWTVGNGLTIKSGESNTSNPIHVKTKSTGTYTLRANYTEDLTSPYTLKGGTNITGDNWKTAHNFTKKSGHSTESVAYCTFNISSTNSGISGEAPEWGFKVIKDGLTWYGLDASGSYWWQRSTSANQPLKTDNQNIQICADVAGPYEIKVDYSTPESPTVTVTFPTSYTLTYSVGDVAGNDGSISSAPTTASGSRVLSGNTITLTAPNAKTGFVWKGWYLAADGSGVQQCATKAYEVTMNADKTLYACYTENSYNVTVSNDGHGTVSPTGTVAIKQVNGTSLTASPSANYVFKDWTISGGGITPTSSSTSPQTFKATTTGGTIRANFADKWNIKGSGTELGNWSTLNGMPYAGASNTFSFSVSLAANTTYDFKVVLRGSSGGSDTYYGKSSTTFTREGTTSVTGLTTESGDAYNMHLTTDIAGIYTFTYVYNSNPGSMQVSIGFPTAYKVTYGKGTGGSTITVTDGSSNAIANNSYVAPGTEVNFAQTAATGYNFSKWYSNSTGSGGTQWGTGSTYQIASIAANANVYSIYTPKNYTVTLDVDEAHKGTIAGATTSQTVYYNTATVTVPNRPTAEQAYGLDGYYTDHDGAGLKVIDSLGVWKANVDGYTDGSKRWIHDGDVTLYAYYKKAEIVDILLDKNPVNLNTSVTATAIIQPAPTGSLIVCWRLLHSSGSPLDPQPAFSSDGGNPISFTSPASGGTYKVEARLRKGSSCGSGEVIDSTTVNLVLAATHTVTIKYKCGDEVLLTQTTMNADPINWTSVSAPDVPGYTFSTWEPGDGITLQSAATTNSNKIQALYDGVLTARYTKKKLILLDLSQTFSPYGKWDNPYVYFYKASYWDDTNGTGEAGADCIWYGAMTKIAGTDIWYYDYSSVPATFNGTVSFTWGNHVGETHFGDGGGCDVIYRGDFSEGTPLFVPATDQSIVNKNGDKGHYFFKGYWTNYYGEHTGYTIIIRENTDGAAEIKRQRFTSADKYMTMQAILPLDANTSYKMEILRDNGRYYKNAYFMKDSPTEKHTNWAFTEETTIGGITSTAAGNYVFTLSYSSGELRLSVEYPAKANDFQIMYYDNSGTTHWSKSHTSDWRHPSRLITAKANAVDTVAFFVAKGKSPTLYARKVNTIDAESGQITWGSLNIAGASSKSLSVDSSYVYIFKVTQSSTAGTIASVENIGAYNGNYYIRCGALNSKWDNYAHDYDHRMTYTAYSESSENPGTKYSHYKAKWCPRGKRVNFCIANDYSPCITDTLWQDDPNTYDNVYPENDGIRPGELKAESYDGSGNITSDPTTDKYSANIRFMWNRHTNKIGRAYVASATTAERQYLVLKGCGEMYNGDGTNFGNPGESQAENRAIFKDDQDFIYERIITIQPKTHAKVYACYTTTDLSKAQYFRGAHDGGACGSDANSIQVIGGRDGDENFYKVRVIYDFKTNRLICAWMPNGTNVDDLPVDADVMVIRDHQEGAEAITFNPGGVLSDVKYVYCVMKFNRWTLNNRARGKGGADDQDENHCKTPEAISEYHPVLPVGEQTSIYERALYFISFPFDVQLSEVFGLGDYGIHWIVSEYNGLRRAREGYFQDNCFNSDCTNWDYIWDPKDKILKAYEGYLLSLEVDSMIYDNTRFWPNNISQKELFFPSKDIMGSITTTNVTLPALGSEYECTKNYDVNHDSPIKDRRVYDSYWRCIGTPSYAPYGAAVKKDNGSGTEITWQSNYSWSTNPNTFPFLYAWNVDDNSLSVQSTNRFNFKPMHAYLVQNKNAMYWTAVSATPSSIVRRQRRAVDEDGDYYWRIILSRGNAEDDQTYVRMSDDEQVTDTFDFGQDLSKEFNYGHSDIYTYIGKTRAAANSMPMNTDTTTIIPLGLNIWAAGQHSISMPDGGDGVGVELVDLYNGVRVNLSAGFVYYFEAEKGIIDDRFQLEISPVKGTHTGIENVNVESADDSKARKVLIDGALYIVRDGKIYDARGARIK